MNRIIALAAVVILVGALIAYAVMASIYGTQLSSNLLAAIVVIDVVVIAIALLLGRKGRE